MRYREFLKMAKITSNDCSVRAYDCIIEPAYMTNDLLFPNKEAVVEHWNRFGLLGFSKDVIETLTIAVKAMQQVRKRAGNPKDGLSALGSFIANAAN